MRIDGDLGSQLNSLELISSHLSSSLLKAMQLGNSAQLISIQLSLSELISAHLSAVSSTRCRKAISIVDIVRIGFGSIKFVEVIGALSEKEEGLGGQSELVIELVG